MTTHRHSVEFKWIPYKSNQVVHNVHSKSKCKGKHCPVHNPSDHHMRDWPQHFRSDRGITERICPHGVGHPDPDDINAKGSDSIHGCDGCCSTLRDVIVDGVVAEAKARVKKARARKAQRTPGRPS